MGKIQVEDEEGGMEWKKEEVRQLVRESYGRIVQEAGGCCGSACGVAGSDLAREKSLEMGYTSGDTDRVPRGSNLGLGCGAPLSFANLGAGETVLDLGSGAGFDCFLAASMVGEAGRVIGVDMTPEMVNQARENAEKGTFRNVSFRLGEIEHLPVADCSVDVIISNCVINLSPDKGQVFREAFRALRPGGRLAISDVVMTASLPGELRRDKSLLAGCVAGAATIPEIEEGLRSSEFERIRIVPKEESRSFIRNWEPGLRIEECVVSAVITAVKP